MRKEDMLQSLSNSEDIMRKHAPDWNQWHENCRAQVLSAMEEYKSDIKCACLEKRK